DVDGPCHYNVACARSAAPVPFVDKSHSAGCTKRRCLLQSSQNRELRQRLAMALDRRIVTDDEEQWGWMDLRLPLGSRLFASHPATMRWPDLRDHVRRLTGAKLGRVECDGLLLCWIDFTYQGHSFGIRNAAGEFWFFVESPDCPDAI